MDIKKTLANIGFHVSWLFSGAGIIIMMNWTNITTWIGANNLFFIALVTIVILVVMVIYLLMQENKKTEEITQSVPNLKEETETILEEYLQKGKKKEDARIKLIDDLKSSINILFIDDLDLDDVKIVDTLRRQGWKVDLIKDIENLDDTKVREADIFFVDVEGVGIALNCEGEGLGLGETLRERYPNKKVIIYSAQSAGNMFHDGIRKVDHILKKNAGYPTFIRLVEKFSIEINSSK
jgi:uncharacterized membrane protein